MVGLVDCNSFYASCERVFRPDLKGRPVAVLSNNDGCIVAMSPEVKQAGIKRGTPVFKVRAQLEQIGAELFSSNYTLYQDLSDRVMEVLRFFTDRLEIYSIDEAFLYTDREPAMLAAYGLQICREVKRLTGIPVSVGFGRTKTLAKVAGSRAKRSGGVYVLSEPAEREVLATVNVLDVWGIGTRKARFLLSHGISTAAKLCDCPEGWVKRHLTLVTLRTVWELKGIPALADEPEELIRKGILTSLGFSREVSDLPSLERAVTSYASNAVHKLLAQGSQTSCVTVFIQTHRFREDYHHRSSTKRLSCSTSYLPDIVSAALELLHRLYEPDRLYSKVGVYLSEIDGAQRGQQDLFDSSRGRRQRAALALYQIERRHGMGVITCRDVPVREDWHMRRALLSACYTTRWNELPRVY